MDPEGTNFYLVRLPRVTVDHRIVCRVYQRHLQHLIVHHEIDTFDQVPEVCLPGRSARAFDRTLDANVLHQRAY